MNRLPATSLFLLLLSLSASAVACGSESHDGVDESAPSAEDGPRAESSAPNGEASASPQAGTPAAPAPVVVSVLGVNGLPEANIGVVFHDAGGAVIGEAKTAADGKASSAGIATPSMVSALLGDARAKHVLTWTTVKAGDVLETKNISWGAPEVGAYAVSLQGAMPGASQYSGYALDCSGYTVKPDAFSIGIRPDCVRAGNTNGVLVFAHGDLGKPIGYAYAKNLPAPTDTKIEVPASAFEAVELHDVVVANIPQNLIAETEVFEVANGVAVHGNYSPVKGEKATFGVAASYAESLQIHSSAWGGGDIAGGWFTVSKRVPTSASQTSVDFANALPRIMDRQKDVTDPARPLLSWTSAGSLAGTDGGHVSVKWFSADDEPRGWTLLLAPGATSVKVPALPASASTFVPPAKEIAGPHVLFVESDAWTDHDAFRRDAGRVMPLGTEYGYGFTVRHTMLPSVGMTLRGTEL